MKFLTLSEAAARLRISVKTLKRHIAEGEILHLNVGRSEKKKRIVIDEADLAAFVEMKKRFVYRPPVSPTTRSNRNVVRYRTFREIQAEKQRASKTRVPD